MPRNKSTRMPDNTFTNDGHSGIIEDHDDPMVISTAIVNAKVKCVLIDQGSSTNILFRDAFDKLD